MSSVKKSLERMVESRQRRINQLKEEIKELRALWAQERNDDEGKPINGKEKAGKTDPSAT